MTFLLLLVILTMTDLCWSQCRTADWWVGSGPKAWAKCGYSTEYVTGFYRNSNNGSNDVIGLLEAARCCNASVPNQNKASDCVKADWTTVLDSKYRWAYCPEGRFIQGIYRSDNGWLRHIELGSCCKPNNLQDSYLHCYKKDVSKSFDSKGWIICGGDYYIVGLFKGNCDQLYCLDWIKCCSIQDSCVMTRAWPLKFEFNGWVYCDFSTHYITGLFRIDKRGSNDKINLLEGAKCCPAPAPDHLKASVCQNKDWRLDKKNVWAECPAGYFIQGFYWKGSDWLHEIEKAKCCKPNGFPNRYETCYDESISFDKIGLSKCTKSDYYVTGLYKGNCRELHCIKGLKCCKMNIDECTVSNPCKNGAVCSDTAGSYKCTCQSGYEGINCDNDIDECADSSCKNGATCINLQGSYRCDCNSGYNGSNCETEINECLFSPCKNGATCVNVVGSYRCDCKSGYTGNDCETDIDECANSPCKNGATCVNLQGSYRCDCNSGYNGSNCETEINECLYSPCKNGATCVNVVGSYRCHCKSGYTGNDCETGIKYCIPGPCQNGGTCIDLGGSYLCVCANGFFGANCEDSEDDSECIS